MEERHKRAKATIHVFEEEVREAIYFVNCIDAFERGECFWTPEGERKYQQCKPRLESIEQEHQRLIDAIHQSERLTADDYNLVVNY
ncbi:hypothetical protein HYV50_02445 [Candidatus Pacearchaeota archaeon]|nr:hypothetical protein [Candidatus Pacearchaeota archaeon]